MEKPPPSAPTEPVARVFAGATDSEVSPTLATRKLDSASVNPVSEASSAIVACPGTGDFRKSAKGTLDVYVKRFLAFFHEILSLKEVFGLKNYFHSLRMLPFRFRKRRLRANDRSVCLQTRNSGTEMHHLYRSQQDPYPNRMLRRYFIQNFWEGKRERKKFKETLHIWGW